MAASSTDSTREGKVAFPLTLVRNKKTKSVLCAEAQKEFVDLLLSFLTLPTGTVLKLLDNGTGLRKMRPISNVFESVKLLEDIHFYDKDSLLDIKPVHPALSSDNMKIFQTEAPKPTSILQHGFHCRCTTRLAWLNHCDDCGSRGGRQVTIDLDGLELDEALGNKRGFVRESPGSRYMITDDLQINPSSKTLAQSIALLSWLEVDVKLSDVEQVEVSVGPREALQLLQASLCSPAALNAVFGPDTTFATPEPVKPSNSTQQPAVSTQQPVKLSNSTQQPVKLSNSTQQPVKLSNST